VLIPTLNENWLSQLVSPSSETTRSHPEMVGDMSRMTLNFDLPVSKIPVLHF